MNRYYKDFSYTWIILVVVCLVASSEALAATIYVDRGASGANDGSSWADACNYLQDALAAASSGDEIWVTAGIYKPDQGPGDRTASFELKNGVGLYGGFAGGETTRDQRDTVNNVTILNGDLNGNDVGDLDDPSRSENSYHVVTGSVNDETAVLDGFTITGGNANGSTNPHQYGGGLINDGSPTLTNCTFTANSAEAGGGMANDIDAGPTLTKCTFNGNSAGSSGGGVFNNGTGLTLVDCTFIANRAIYGAGMYNYKSNSSTLTNCTFSDNRANNGYGGGMYNGSSSPTVTDCTFSGNLTDRGGGMANFDSSSPVVTNCTFSDNSADYYAGGGGMYNSSSSPTVINCSFSGNNASPGGGISNESSSPTVTNCKFYGNTAGYGGGGMRNVDSSSPTVTNCAFSGNSTLEDGGGMYNRASSSPTVTNCTFSGNEAGTASGFSGHGGGMYNWSSSSPTVTNCTFTQNSAGAPEDGGGGMYNLSSSSPTVTNCIFWSNLPSEIRNNSAYASLTYCDVLGGYAGEANINTDPLFMDADGPDDTIGTADDNLRLLAGSLCIDAGDTSAVPIGITTDLDGKPRFSDDPDTDDTGSGTPPIVDMGAYEFAGGIPPKYHPADPDSDYVISMLEILGYIDEWAVGNVSMLEVLEGIDLWAAGHYYWDASAQQFKPGTQP